MKHTVISAKSFSFKNIKFLPGDEFDYKALGLDFYEFKKFINVRYLSYGVPGREIKEVINDSGFEFDEKNWKIGNPIVSEKENLPENDNGEQGDNKEDENHPENHPEDHPEKAQENTTDNNLENSRRARRR